MELEARFANCVVICKTKRFSGNTEPKISFKHSFSFCFKAHFQACKMHINNKPILLLPLMSETFLVEKDENVRWHFFCSHHASMNNN